MEQYVSQHNLNSHLTITLVWVDHACLFSYSFTDVLTEIFSFSPWSFYFFKCVQWISFQMSWQTESEILMADYINSISILIDSLNKHFQLCEAVSL